MTLRPLKLLLMAGAGWTAVAAVPALGAACDQQLEQVREGLAQGELSGSERREYRALLRTAWAMQQNGDEQLCLQILARTQALMQQRAAGPGLASVASQQASAARYAPVEDAKPFSEIARFESIRELDVVNSKGEDLGQVVDLVIDFGAHRVQYALLSMSGGFLDDPKLYPVPVDVLKIGDDPAPDAARGAPGAANAPPAPVGAPLVGAGQNEDGRKLGAIAQMTVGELVGSEVENDRGDAIGEIEALVLPAGAAQVEAVLSVGGWLGIGDKSVAIPLDRLTMNGEGLRFETPVTADELERLPKVEIDDQERLPDDTVIAEVVPPASQSDLSAPPATAEPGAARRTAAKPAAAPAPGTDDGAADDPLADKVLVLDVDRATLEGAPAFADGAYPDLADAEWHKTVLAFYENVLQLGDGSTTTEAPTRTSIEAPAETPAKPPIPTPNKAPTAMPGKTSGASSGDAPAPTGPN